MLCILKLILDPIVSHPPVVTRSLSDVGYCRLRTVRGFTPLCECADLLHALWLGTARDCVGSIIMDFVEKWLALQHLPTWDERLEALTGDVHRWCVQQGIRPSTIETLSILVCFLMRSIGIVELLGSQQVHVWPRSLEVVGGCRYSGFSAGIWKSLRKSCDESRLFHHYIIVSVSMCNLRRGLEAWPRISYLAQRLRVPRERFMSHLIFCHLCGFRVFGFFAGPEFFLYLYSYPLKPPYFIRPRPQNQPLR